MMVVSWGDRVPLMTAALASVSLGSLFACADAALGTLSESRLKALATEAPEAHRKAFQRFLESGRRITTRWLVARVTAIAIAAVLLHEAMQGTMLEGIGPLAPVMLGVLVYATLAEVMGNLARRAPESTGAMALVALRPLEVIVAPIAEPIAIAGRILGRLVPLRPNATPRVTQTEVHWVVSEGVKTGAIPHVPARIIEKALTFKDKTIREVMVPRSRICAIELNTPLSQVLETIAEEGHSRYPVYRDTIDNVVGLLYAKDLFSVVREGRLESTALMELLRAPVLCVASKQAAAQVLPDMRSKRLHMAIVVDEFGGTSGLVTLEDLLEEIVGDIRDEYDTDDGETPVQRISEGRFMADAAVSLSDLASRIGWSPPSEGSFESLGGLLVHRAGRVPEVGATLELDGVRFIVCEADEKKVMKVEILSDVPRVAPAATG